MNTNVKDVLGFMKSMLQFTTRLNCPNVAERWKEFFPLSAFHSRVRGGVEANKKINYSRPLSPERIRKWITNKSSVAAHAVFNFGWLPSAPIVQNGVR